jgi:hypothetical protein
VPQEGIVMKKVLSFEELEGQTAVELPDREMMALITIVIGAIVITIPIQIEDVAVQICGVLLAQGIECTVTQ